MNRSNSEMGFKSMDRSKLEKRPNSLRRFVPNKRVKSRKRSKSRKGSRSKKLLRSKKRSNIWESLCLEGGSSLRNDPRLRRSSSLERGVRLGIDVSHGRGQCLQRRERNT